MMRGQRRDEPPARAGHAVGVVQIDDGARRGAVRQRAAWTSGAAGRRPSGCTVQNTQGVSSRRSSGEHGEVGHAPRRPEEARRLRPPPGRWRRARPRPRARWRAAPQRQRLRWLQCGCPGRVPPRRCGGPRGAAAARRPIRKKAAWTPARRGCRARAASSRRSGPSSKVRAASGRSRRPRQTLPRVSRCEPHVYAAHATGAAASQAGFRTRAPWRWWTAVSTRSTMVRAACGRRKRRTRSRMLRRRTGSRRAATITRCSWASERATSATPAMAAKRSLRASWPGSEPKEMTGSSAARASPSVSPPALVTRSRRRP